MTRKHFRELAATLKANMPSPVFEVTKTVQWRADVSAIANACSLFNPQFDRAKFLDACGMS